jgi:hypothetical protein
MIESFKNKGLQELFTTGKNQEDSSGTTEKD